MNPLSGLYGGVTALRNTLFDRGVLVERRLKKPVISVGNLSAGGTGKTPFVIALGELLKDRGVRFDVLSRGYRRRTRGVLVVEESGTAAEFGDEPLLMARRLGVPVIVGGSRYDAGRLAEEKFQSQLHILDDGFQHRSLARELDIVLVAENDFHDRLLPIGRLREPVSSLSRASAIVLSHNFPGSDYRSLLHSFIQPETLIWRMRRKIDIESEPAAPIVFCGIAQPKQFFDQVRDAGIVPAAEIEFRDHNAYDMADVARLIRLRGKLNAGGFLTTEKDAVNLGALQARLSPFSVALLNVALEDSTAVVNAVLAITKLKGSNLSEGEGRKPCS